MTMPIYCKVFLWKRDFLFNKAASIFFSKEVCIDDNMFIPPLLILLGLTKADRKDLDQDEDQNNQE